MIAAKLLILICKRRYTYYIQGLTYLHDAFHLFYPQFDKAYLPWYFAVHENYAFDRIEKHQDKGYFRPNISKSSSNPRNRRQLVTSPWNITLPWIIFK